FKEKMLWASRAVMDEVLAFEPFSTLAVGEDAVIAALAWRGGPERCFGVFGIATFLHLAFEPDQETPQGEIAGGYGALVAAYGWAARVPRWLAWAWCASWPLTHLALLAKPELLHYGGLSGVLHGGVAAVSLWLLLRGQGAQRTVGWMMLVGQSIKLLVEEPWGAVIHPPTELDVAVAPLAHATGSLAALLCAAVALTLTRQPSRPGTH
ncbi:MAG: hypothetical protein J0M00_22430, partial [Burkholderiales bacterium]|nr:hypothetical protein [Burkholderiales bacterium]